MRWYHYILLVLGGIAFTFSFFLDAHNILAGSGVPGLKIGDYFYAHSFYRFGGTPSRGELITFYPPDDTGKKYIKRLIGMPGDRLRIRQVPACQLPALTGVEPDPAVLRERTYECGGPREPVVALVEYKPGDQGEWRNFRPVELPTARAREALIDADVVSVLPVDVLPPEFDSANPTMFQETIGGRQVRTVEASYKSGNLVDLGEEGFVIQPDTFFVLGDNRDDSKDSRYLGPIPRHLLIGRGLMIYMSFDFRDDVCREYVQLVGRYGKTEGFDLPDFPPEDQADRCHEADIGYFRRGWTLAAYLSLQLKRWGRASPRWSRIGKLL